MKTGRFDTFWGRVRRLERGSNEPAGEADETGKSLRGPRDEFSHQTGALGKTEPDNVVVVNAVAVDEFASVLHAL
jgi:hypothetical protein